MPYIQSSNRPRIDVAVDRRSVADQKIQLVPVSINGVAGYQEVMLPPQKLA